MTKDVSGRWFRGFAVLAALGLAACSSQLAADSLSDMQRLGKEIFFDQRLSINANQSCATCHSPEVGWTGPHSEINAKGGVYEGSIPGRFGDRKPPSSGYATQSPQLHQDKKGVWVGGNFWDGRATGARLGNPAADQAQGPFLNPMEQALPDSACVVYKVCTSSYQGLLSSVWGPDACTIAWPENIDTACAIEGSKLNFGERAKSDKAYDLIALAIAAYESSPEVNAFSSAYDLSFRGKAKLTKEQHKGFALFSGKGKCKNCHIATGPGALFTDYTYDNVGIPKNPQHPHPEFVDEGLGAYLRSTGYPPSVYGPELGKVKVPTLRNVDRRPYPGFVKAFGHNGYFKSLKEIVHFYNTRDVLPECAPGDPGEKVSCWPATEYPATVNREELGNLGLTDAEENAIVEFMKALSDGYQP